MRVVLGLTWLLAASTACITRTGHEVPLQAGVYRISPPNTPETLHGIELHLDLEGQKATLVDGDERIELRIERTPDRRQWVMDCGTMTGWAELEPAQVWPGSFSLRGQTFAFDMVHADCGSGLRLVESGNHDHRWIFDRLR